MEIHSKIVKRGGTIYIKVPFDMAQLLNLDNYTEEKTNSERVILKNISKNNRKILVTLK